MPVEFTCTLLCKGLYSRWTCLHVPEHIVIADTPRRIADTTRRIIPVAGTINGFPFRRTLQPLGRSHYMMVDKTLLAGANAAAGEIVRVRLRIDRRPRLVRPPAELAEQLKQDKVARSAFKRLTPAHQKEYADWCAVAKKPETRVLRAARSAHMLRAGKRFRDNC